MVMAEPECLASDLTIAETKNAIIHRGKRGEVLAEAVGDLLGLRLRWHVALRCICARRMRCI